MMSTVRRPSVSNHKSHKTPGIPRMPAADEQQLVREAKDGNRDAYRRLVERHMKQAYNVAYGFVRNHESARDVMQDALVRAYQALPTFRGDAEFGTWLHRIVMNLSLNHLRARNSRSRHEVRIDDVQEPGTTQDAEHESRFLRSHIERALHELPTLQRSVVILRHVEGLSTRQVSGILQCSEGTVKTHLHRGLKKLRERLQCLQEDAA